MSSSRPLRFALVGCGAISELYYCPALDEVSKHVPIEMVALCDPSQDRINALLKFFPIARAVSNVGDLIATSPELAIVASPSRFHANQVNELLASGVHVLCEKPMASSVLEAESMIMAARKANRILAIGLFRRFFPALQTVKSLVSEGSLGPVKHFHFEEGGVFNWPAATASFFQKESSQGGVLQDLGVHILDLICWWFGEPISLYYQDDMMGNLESNCRLSLAFASGLTGDVRMSRDTPCSNSYRIMFERGQIIWKVGDGNHLDLTLNGIPYDFSAELKLDRQPASTYCQSFVKQLLNFINASRGLELPGVSGEEGIRSLKLIDYCYSNRHLINMPWLSDLEIARSHQFSAGQS